jgi:hypothetical protein
VHPSLLLPSPQAWGEGSSNEGCTHFQILLLYRLVIGAT